MSLFVASLYLLLLAFLFGSALYVYSRDPLSRLNASFALLVLSLLGWVGTLFVFSAQRAGPGLLWWGRANFAAAAVVAPATFLFVRALAQKPGFSTIWLWSETLLVAGLSLFTGVVDQAEAIQAGEHVTAYGALFPLYVLHAVAFVLAALLVAFQPAPRLSPRQRAQLRLVGIGILLTAVVGVTTNAALPYFFNDFRFIHVGTLSTIFFLVTVAYAACVYHLFRFRLIIKVTLVFGLLIAFALELYQLAVGSLTGLLPLEDPTQRHIAAAAVALIINAFTQKPLHSWLERLVDRLLAGKRRRHPNHAHLQR